MALLFSDTKMTFINVTSNSTMLTNDTWYNETYVLEDPFYERMEEMCINFLLICCALAMCLNIIVVISIHWIRTPLKPNLKIRLIRKTVTIFLEQNI
ncbi:unnamed protein product [Acanthoscelides obtectus]|uniref:Uncharacterized protein n=1 Tax=Acanthoscelides obtectus TaxID=200917 RepID=A0A9P0KFE6_ACAOB|nr:unnamed protein product [Acanthoscelides obtectus]CAK1669311.1 hypothetical protein AOBTE_LOCUS26952 [Acanthoscelides obtectus]